MKPQSMIFLVAAVVMFAASVGAQSMPIASDDSVTFSERDLSGPRMGVTFIPPSSPLGQKLQSVGLGSLFSQFGWHFESLVTPSVTGPSFSVQFIPLLTGIEYGHFIMNFTVAFGIRMPGGLEFGMGPNLLLGDIGESTSLMLAIGKSFNYGGVSIPLDFVVVVNQTGTRFGLMTGYAIHKARN